MKRVVLTSFFLFLVNISLHAQDAFFTDSLRKHLKNYLVNKDVASNKDHYSPFNLIIFNEISGKNIDIEPEAHAYKYGIYSFKGIETPNFYEILIRRGEEYEILGVLGGKSLMEIIKDLISYFDRYPEVPQRLFPLYVNAVTKVYNANSHWEGAYNVKKKRDISEYGDFTDSDTIYRIIEDSDGQIEFFID